MKLARALMNHGTQADRSGVEIQKTRFLIESRGIREHAFVGRLRFDVADSAEGSHNGKRVQMRTFVSDAYFSCGDSTARFSGAAFACFCSRNSS